MSWWSSLFRVSDGIYTKADGSYVLRGVNDTQIRLGTSRTWSDVNKRWEYSEGSGANEIKRLGDGSEILKSGGYKVSSNPDIYRIDSYQQGKGVDLPSGTTRTTDGKFKLPDETEIPGGSKKMADGSFRLPDGSYKLTNTSLSKIKTNKSNVKTDARDVTDLKKSSDIISDDVLKRSDDLEMKLNETTIKNNTIKNRARNSENALKNRKALDDIDVNKKLDADYEKIKKRRINAMEKALGLVGLAALIGGLLMDRSGEANNASNNRKGCVTACLPHNYSDYFYGKISKDELKYTTMDSLREEFPNAQFPEDQPFCQEGNDNCYEHCKAACFNLYQEEEEEKKKKKDGEEPPFWKSWFPDVDENLIISVIAAILAVILIAFLIMIFSLYSS